MDFNAACALFLVLVSLGWVISALPKVGSKHLKLGTFCTPDLGTE